MTTITGSDSAPALRQHDEPCKCHRNFAYIAPTHSGHCCFLSRFATCHPDEVAAWVRKRDGIPAPLPRQETQTP